MKRGQIVYRYSFVDYSNMVGICFVCVIHVIYYYYIIFIFCNAISVVGGRGFGVVS